VWLLYDDKNGYGTPCCEDSQPERDVANEMRRDGKGTSDHERLRWRSIPFTIGATASCSQALAGGLFDGYITDEGDRNHDGIDIS
jgi:hypothetical protein